MARNLFIFMVLAAIAAAPAHAGLIPDWGMAFGDEGTLDRVFQAITAVDTDSDGNIYIAGDFYGQIDFGGPTLYATTANAPDVFVAKLTPDGQHVWSIAGGGTGYESINDIYVLPSGSVAVVGGTNSPTFTIDGEADTTHGGYDALVMVFGSTGSHSFTRVLGGPLTDLGAGIVWDASALSIMVSGTFWSTVDFGVGAPITSNGQADFFLAEIKVWGAMANVWTGGGTGNESGGSLCLDDDGNLGFTGGFQGTMNLGNGPLTAVGNGSVVIAKFPSVGSAPTWSQAFHNESHDGTCWGNSIETDGASYYVTGGFNGTANFGAHDHTSYGGYDIWTAAYKSGDGTPGWSASGGSVEDDFPGHVDCYGGRLIVTGSIGEEATFYPAQLYHSNRFDAVMVIYDDEGALAYARRGGGTWDDFGYAATMNEDGIYFVGSFGEQGVWSGLTLNALDSEPDGFLVHYMENEFVGISEAETGLPAALSLGLPTPNPAREGTTLDYGASRAGGLESAAVYDVAGRLVRTLPTESSARNGRLHWDGRNDSGAPVAAGVYFLRANDGASIAHRRITVVH